MKSSVEQDASKGNNIFSELDHKGFFFLLCRIISHSLFEGNEKENCISSPSPAPYFNKYLGIISCPLIWIISLWNGFFLPSPACFQFFAYKEMIMLPLSHPFLFSSKLELSIIFSPWYHFLGLWSKASYLEIKLDMWRWLRIIGIIVIFHFWFYFKPSQPKENI